MEILEIFSHPVFVSLCVMFLVYCVKQCIRPKNFPNGPVLIPFVGSAWTIPPKGMEFLIPKWKKKYGNIIGHKLYYENLFVICGHEEINEALKHPNFQGRYHAELFLQRTRNQPLGFFFADGETWTELRRFTMRYLGTIFTTGLETILHDEISEEFDTIQSGAVSIIEGKFMKSPLNVILRLLVGANRKDYRSQVDDIQDKTEKAFNAGRLSGIELVYPSLLSFFDNHVQIAAISATHAFFRDRLVEHRKLFNPLNITDYTDAFINESMKEFKLNGEAIHFTEDEFLSCCLDLVQAGNESVGKTIQFTLMYVAMNLHIQDKLHEEIDEIIGHDRYPTLNDRIKTPYLEATLYEGMRINPISAMGVMHRVTEDTYFKDYFFEKGSLIQFALRYAMNDPEKWKNPDEFVPDRFLTDDRSRKKLPNFGLGKRSCLAEILAKNFMYLYLAYFFQRFSIRLPDGYKPSTYPILGFTNGPQPYKLIITQRDIAKILIK